MAITIQETAITYSSIQNAVNGVCYGAGLSQDTTILIDDGTYSEYVVINSQGVLPNIHTTNGYTLTLKSTGNSVYLNGGGTMGELIRINAMSNITVDGINLINCSQSNTGGANFRVLGISANTASTNITFKNATIRNGYAAVRATTYVYGITFDNILVSGFGYGGIRCGNSPDIIRDLILNNSTFTKIAIPIDSGNSFTTLN
jgi:hypothetical protein